MSNIMTGLGQEAAQVASRLNQPVRPQGLKGAPAVKTGPIQDSEVFSLANLIIKGQDARLERSICSDFTSLLKSTGMYLATADQGSLWIPNSLEFLSDPQLNQTSKGEALTRHVKAMMTAANQIQVDPEEMARLRKSQGMHRKAGQSAFVDNLGATLVQPPTQGEVIPLIRPQPAAIAAGARQISLPPSGRLVLPRITGAVDVMAVSEGGDPAEGTLETGELVFTAKKIVGIAEVNDEATLFTQGAIDALIRESLSTSLGLKQDVYIFYGLGSTLMPAGLTNRTAYPEVLDFATTYPTSRFIGANGNSLLPEYGDRVPALIDDRSFNQNGYQGTWVMRPSVYGAVASVRADAVSPGDQAGPLVDMMRKFAAPIPNEFRGRQVVQSTNIRNDRTKGTGTGLTDVFYGIWQFCTIATYGAIQLSEGTVNAQFTQGKKMIKGTMYGDSGFTQPGAFVWMTDVQGLNANNM